MNLATRLRRALPNNLYTYKPVSIIMTANKRTMHTTGFLRSVDPLPFSCMKGKLDSALLEGLDAMGLKVMTPVQNKVLNDLPSLKSDCLVQAKTGTGKTVAFLLPAIQTLLERASSSGQVSVLILSPTRELALQIAWEATQLVAKMHKPPKVHTAFGGTQKATRLNDFMKETPAILVATPGRLNDYLDDQAVRARFNSLRTLILDEADTMLEAGFLPDILRILQALPSKDLSGWQGMCFSATVPPKIKAVLPNVLNKNYTTISTIDSSEPPTLARVPQYSVVIPSVKDTFKALTSTINVEVSHDEEAPKIIVFGTTARLVVLYAQFFKPQTSLKVFELHSRLTQPARIRTTTEFKNAESGIMFATDVIGRGMDFPNVTLVVQVGLPLNTDAYTHRVGRTARAGKDGRAIIILTEPETYFLRANPQFPVIAHPASDAILEDDLRGKKALEAMNTIDNLTKTKAYSTYLGFMKTFVGHLKMDNQGLVKMANELALEGMGCDEVPGLDKKIVSKTGLKGVPGLRYQKPEIVSKKSNQPAIQDKSELPPRRLKHQEPPSAMNDPFSDKGSATHALRTPKQAPRSGTPRGRGGISRGRGGTSRGHDNSRRSAAGIGDLYSTRTKV